VHRSSRASQDLVIDHFDADAQERQMAPTRRSGMGSGLCEAGRDARSINRDMKCRPLTHQQPAIGSAMSLRRQPR